MYNILSSSKVLNSRITSNGLVSTMTYLAPTDSELTLACWASNGVGRQEIPCLIHIVPASKLTRIIWKTIERKNIQNTLYWWLSLFYWLPSSSFKIRFKKKVWLEWFSFIFMKFYINSFILFKFSFQMKIALEIYINSH